MKCCIKNINFCLRLMKKLRVYKLIRPASAIECENFGMMFIITLLECPLPPRGFFQFWHFPLLLQLSISCYSSQTKFLNAIWHCHCNHILACRVSQISVFQFVPRILFLNSIFHFPSPTLQNKHFSCHHYFTFYRFKLFSDLSENNYI